MNACELEIRLTAYLLGDLPASEADAVRQHLADCAACRALARQLEPVLADLRAGLAPAASEAPRLAPLRRRRALQARPPKPASAWFTAHRPALLAASLAVLAGLILPAMFSSVSVFTPRRASLGDSGAAISSLESAVPPSEVLEREYSADAFDADVDGPAVSTPPAPAEPTAMPADRAVGLSVAATRGLRTDSHGAFGNGREVANEINAPFSTPAAPATAAPEARYADAEELRHEKGTRREIAKQAKKLESTDGKDKLQDLAYGFETVAPGGAVMDARRAREGRDQSGQAFFDSAPAQAAAAAPAPILAPAKPALSPARLPASRATPVGGRAPTEYYAKHAEGLGEKLGDVSGLMKERKAGRPSVVNGALVGYSAVAGQEGLRAGDVTRGDAAGTAGKAIAGQRPSDEWSAHNLARDAQRSDDYARKSEASADRLLAEAGEKVAASTDEDIVRKMKSIVIPEVNFRSARLEDVASFFASASREYDAPTDGAAKGVNFSLRLPEQAQQKAQAEQQIADPFAAPAAGSAAAGVPPVTLSAHDVTLHDAAKVVAKATGMKLDTSDGFVTFVPDPDAKPAAHEEERVATPAPDAPPPARERTPAAHNPFVETAANPFSTFAIDVDTASYTLTRQALQAGQLPDPEVVRTEEIVNAFDYGDSAPEHGTFRIYVEGAPSPFGADHTLLRVGVKGRRLGREEQRPAMLTFLIDTSGSMDQPDRIGLARQAFALLLEQLAPADRIQVVAYNDHARLVLAPTAASEKPTILAAFDRLQCTGSTNLEDGMRQAYEQAARAFRPGAENRVILVSDGVANLGAGSAADILAQVESFRRQGITCSVFGVGRGTYNDRMLEELANRGDGTYRFLDSVEEVRRAFVDDLSATLNTIASDVKIQVEWYPQAVARYRQLGYENRALTAEQFRDDAVDAGEVGSGQSVTALYELDRAASAPPRAPLGMVRVRYRRVDTHAIEEIEQPILPEHIAKSIDASRPGLRLAAGAAEFAEILRRSPHAAGSPFSEVARLLRPVALDLRLDTRVSELVRLVEVAAGMTADPF